MAQVISCVLTVAAVGLMFAALSITRECRRTIQRNFRRLDGSWSFSRTRRELRMFLDYALSLFVPLLLALPLSLLAAQYVVEDLMPARQIADAFSQYSPKSGEWAAGLENVREEHRAWLSEKGVTGDDATAFQRALWYGWPLVAVVVTSLAVLCLWTFRGVSRSAVAHYVAGIRCRREGYARRDVLLMMGHAADEVSGHASSST